MRVNFLGNICNNHYVLAKALRKAGVDARLYLFDDKDFNVRPESDDLNLQNDYPSWIIKGRYKLWQVPPLQKLQEMMEADLIISHADTALHFPDPIYKRLIIFPYGSDIFVFPFVTPYYKELFPNPIYQLFSLKKKIKRVYSLSKKILLSGYDIHWKRAYQELLFPDTVIYPLGLIVDNQTFRPSVAPHKPTLPLQIFQSCRQLWERRSARTWGSKGNDIFFRGLAEAVRCRPGAFEVTLVDGKSGEEESSRRLLQDLGLDGIVRWIPRMPRARLITHYQNCDLVVDGLVAGAYGYAPLEAMACGKPIMMYIVEQQYAKVFGEDAPIINARTPAQVAEHLVHYADHPDELTNIGQQARGYVLRQHSEEALVPRYLAMFESILDPAKPARTIMPEIFRLAPDDNKYS